MRNREEIVDQLAKTYERTTKPEERLLSASNLQLEVLLDIRDLLKAIAFRRNS